MTLAHCLLRFTLTCAALCAGSPALAADNALGIAGKRLTLAPSCAQGHRSGRDLARYLAQYDPAQDPRDDSADERPRSRKEIAAIRAGLVDAGLHYPNGQDSVITWMDVDGDGVCDFAASAGIGGMHAIDRMFLFRGLATGAFVLADAYHTYMEGRIVLAPYVPLAVAGEKLPVLATNSTLLQWHAESKQLASCETIKYGPQASRQRAAMPALASLCPHAQAIYTWAADRLPHKNEVDYASGSAAAATFELLEPGACTRPALPAPSAPKESHRRYGMQRRWLDLDGSGRCVLMDVWTERQGDSDAPGMRTLETRLRRVVSGKWQDFSAEFKYFPLALRSNADRKIYLVDAPVEDDVDDSMLLGGGTPQVFISKGFTAQSRENGARLELQPAERERAAVLLALADLLAHRGKQADIARIALLRETAQTPTP